MGMFGAQAPERDVAHRLAVRERRAQASYRINALDRGLHDPGGIRRRIVHVFKLAPAVRLVTGTSQAG